MITKKDLKDQILEKDGSFLFCELCGNEFSANKGDYFQMKDDDFFQCPDDGTYMVLATKKIHINVIKR
jgi:hypothetical protein